MAVKIKAIIQTLLLTGVLAIVALAAVPKQGNAIPPGEKGPNALVFCPTGGANCGADDATGTLYKHSATVTVESD